MLMTVEMKRILVVAVVVVIALLNIVIKKIKREYIIMILNISPFQRFQQIKAAIYNLPQDKLT